MAGPSVVPAPEVEMSNMYGKYVIGLSIYVRSEEFTKSIALQIK